ncbi:class I SAM-dependent methyltransferase [Candidatus Woesearchaeota archaeon]|nr:class I SAM-dependent methyltransferase [Candidatus Woesearchaeota archaeon]
MVEMGYVSRLFVNSRLLHYFHKLFGIARLLDMSGNGGLRTVLELGCGVGITTRFIASKFAKAKIVAVDYESQIRIARKRNLPNVRFVAGDATKLQFNNNSFDAVFESFAFHHIPGYGKAIEEAYRVLKPGGKFWIVDFALKSLPFHWLVAFEPVHFTKREFVCKLKSNRFSVTKGEGGLIFRIEAIKPS